MLRASWRGFLRPSLVSCPIYLSPATTRMKPIRLHQVRQNQPRSMWTRTTCWIGVEGRVLRHRHLGDPPTMPAMMATGASPPPGSRFGRMIPEPARRSTNARS